MIGQLADGKPKVLLQLPGQPWTELQVPEPAEGELRLYSAVAAVADGFLVTGTSSSHGNDRVRIWHVDGSGSITERATLLQTAAPGAGAGDKPHITNIVNTGGKTIAFGSLRSQPAIWELDGDRNFSNYTTFSSEDNQTLDRISVGAHGQMLLGRTRTANGHLPVIWSRRDGQEWSVYARNIFGSETRYGESPVSAVLPSSHGFLAAGSYYTDGTNHAGLAVSEDGDSWSQVQSGELRGSSTAGRSIAALAETPARAVLAGGYIEEPQGSSPAVWASVDAQTWKAVSLPRSEGYVDAKVVSLTPGPLRTVAVVQSRASGKPARYSTFSSGDDGLTWEPGTDLDVVSPEQDLTAPRVVPNGEGFVLLATQGPPGHHAALLMLSQDGKQFAARELSHGALDHEGLTLSAAGIAGKKLLITGTAGPADGREPFGIAVDVPAL
jgi:hypothetical protein